MYADNLKCVTSRQLLRAASFTIVHVRLLGQERAPTKSILPSTWAVVHKEMKG